MNSELYPMIFKRKSFHTYMNTGDAKLSRQELDDISAAFEKLTPLMPDIRMKMTVRKEADSTCHRGNEYALYFYSEPKDGYLLNAGYVIEQMDLWLVSQNIGTLWFGIGKPDEASLDGMVFVIMMGIKKVPQDKFRKDMFKSKRKEIEEIWQGETIEGVTNIVRFTPSACNTQPWIVKREDDKLVIYRYKNEGKRGIMPADRIVYYNRIDLGIFLLFLELCLEHEGIPFVRKTHIENSEEELNLTAEYTLSA